MNAATTLCDIFTPWFPAHVHPVREGVYQLLNTLTGSAFFARWFRGQWMVGSFLAEKAGQHTLPSVVQDRWQWRGLMGEICPRHASVSPDPRQRQPVIHRDLETASAHRRKE